MNILVVDDDEIIRKGIVKIIERSELPCPNVKEASDGCMALDLLEANQEIDLLITDIRMPVMDGLELIKEIRKRMLCIKIIVLSGFDDYKYVHQAFLSGAVDYLLKPVDHIQFHALLGRIRLSIAQESHAAKDLKESNSLVMGNLLERLFQGKSSKEECNRLMKFNIDLINPYAVLITRLDHNYKERYSPKEDEMKLTSLSAFIISWFRQNTDFQVYQYQTNFEVVSLLFDPRGDFDVSQFAALHPFLLSDMEESRTCTAGIGNIHSGWGEAQTAYREAMEAADIRFYQGAGHFIIYREVHGKCIDMQYELEGNVNMLSHYLELCDYVNAKHIMDRLFLELSYLRPHKFRRYMIEVIEILMLRVLDFENAILSSEPDYKFNLNHINTYNELRTYMSSIMQSAILFIRSERDKRSKRRIEMAKTYIQTHYMEVVTLNDVAEYVELNPSYFSNLFKAEVGINFSDYLMDTRMNMAKKYLRNPKIRIYEIGNMVGYEDAVSFGRAFKKKLRMSPKEYRNAVY